MINHCTRDANVLSQNLVYGRQVLNSCEVYRALKDYVTLKGGLLSWALTKCRCSICGSTVSCINIKQYHPLFPPHLLPSNPTPPWCYFPLCPSGAFELTLV